MQITGVVKSYALTRKRKKFAKIFEKYLYFNNVYLTGALSQLILRIA